MTDTPTYFTERVTFTDHAEEADAITLAQARVQIATEGGLPYPTWKELTDHERTRAVLDARNYLRAAHHAGLLQSRSDEVDELCAHVDKLRAHVDVLDATLPRTRQELRHAYEDCDRLERQHGTDQLALRHALGIPPGEPWTMTRLIRRVRQVVADVDESRRAVAAASSHAVHLAGQMDQVQQVVGEVQQLFREAGALSGHDPLDEALARHARDEEPVATEPERPATNQELVTALDTMASVAGELRV